jgi:hypothetical protein
MVNMYGYPNTKIHNHDYVICFDDESGFVKDLDFDPIEKIRKRKRLMGAMITGQRLNNGKPPQNHIDTRVGLWQLVEDFCKKYAAGQPPWGYGKEIFHELPWSDGYVINTVIYESALWYWWVLAVNLSSGIYKHRWGDNEIYSLFWMIYQGMPIYNLRIVEDGYLTGS